MKHYLCHIKQTISVVILLLASIQVQAEDGYDLWLRYKVINDAKLLQRYRNSITGFNINTDSPTLLAAREEREQDDCRVGGSMPKDHGASGPTRPRKRRELHTPDADRAWGSTPTTPIGCWASSDAGCL